MIRLNVATALALLLPALAGCSTYCLDGDKIRDRGDSGDTAADEAHLEGDGSACG